MNSNFYNSPYIDEDFVRGIQYINPQYSAGFYSTRLLKEAKPEIVSEVIMGQIISVTGYNHEKDLIEDSLRQLGGIIGDKDIWQEEQFIVIGRFAYDENYLKESISLGLYIEKPFNYISF